MLKGFLICLAFLIAWIVGWEMAHKMIAAECERNGGFFVGKRDYRCVLIRERK